MNIIQFLPYFPPHKGWLETVSQELSLFYVAGNYGEIINVVFDVGQNYDDKNYEYIFHQSNEKIGYQQNGYIVYFLPSFDIIPNFPVPKFWKKSFWNILWLLSWEIKKNKTIIQTHTRFFLSSFLWWLFAKYHKIKWVHIEHGSDYVKLWSKLKSKISYVYDRIIWAWIFAYADKIVAISEWVKNFIYTEFTKKDIEVIYNGIDFVSSEKNRSENMITIGFVGRLVKLKWVDLLLEVFQELEKKYDNIVLKIVWDGEEREKLELLKWKNVIFLWLQNREYVKDFLSSCDILVNPSYQEWLPTTVLEWLLSKCVVVGTDVGGTKEISDLDDLIIVEKWNKESLQQWIIQALETYVSVSWKSYQSVLMKFDWKENIKKYFNLYNSL